MKPIHYVTGALAIVIVIMMILWPDTEPASTQPWKDTITSIETKLADTVAQNQVLRDSIKKINIEHREEKEVFKTTIDRLLVKKASQRPKVDSLIFDNPVLIEYVNTADSIIEVQGHRIEVLEYQFGKLSMSNEALTANFESQLELHRQKYEASQNLAEEYRKENRKVKRANRFLKAGAVVLGVGGLFLGSQL